jgi:hypothetical protein
VELKVSTSKVPGQCRGWSGEDPRRTGCNDIGKGSDVSRVQTVAETNLVEPVIGTDTL